MYKVLLNQKEKCCQWTMNCNKLNRIGVQQAYSLLIGDRGLKRKNNGALSGGEITRWRNKWNLSFIYGLSFVSVYWYIQKYFKVNPFK